LKTFTLVHNTSIQDKYVWIYASRLMCK
jgi:hypothetical protein